MCVILSITVFCIESIECFPAMASKFFLKPSVNILVALYITGIILHFRFHIRLISIHNLLYSSFFSASFCHHSSVCRYCHIYQCACFLLSVLNHYIWHIYCNFSVCVCCLIPPHCNIFLFTHWCVNRKILFAHHSSNSQTGLNRF